MPRQDDPLQYAVLDVAWQVGCLPVRLRRRCSPPLRALLRWVAEPERNRSSAEERLNRLRDRLRSISLNN